MLVSKDVPLVRQKNVLEWIYDLLLHTILPGTNPSGQVFALIDLTPLLYQLVPLIQVGLPLRASLIFLRVSAERCLPLFQAGFPKFGLFSPILCNRICSDFVKNMSSQAGLL